MNKMLAALVVTAVAVPTVAVVAQKNSTAIAVAVAGPSRTPAYVLRDKYRHPAETLAFFGVRPDQTVVEFQPSGGWYTEILAPMLAARGRYVGLTGPSQKARDGFAAVLAKGGTRYGRATAATLDPATGASTVPDGSADVVLTFRNVHNLIMAGGGNAENAFKAFHRMLKPGGTLGVVDHRLPENADMGAEMKSGYLKRSTVVRLATEAGFRLAAESQVNANPKDTHDWPAGVWTLPPTLQRGAVDREKYIAVGESDRMTLRFVKPKG